MIPLLLSLLFALFSCTSSPEIKRGIDKDQLVVAPSDILESDAEAQLTKYPLPEGDLKWSMSRPENAKMCLPAAFTGKDGNVEGSYRLDGKNYQTNHKRKTSLVGNTFVVSAQWQSDNGFQMVTLVYNGAAVQLNKDDTKKIRRALGKFADETFILQSDRPLTLQAFADLCTRYCDYAVYLDMGKYGYGFIKYPEGTKHLHLRAYLSQFKQTNWLYIE